ncbi:MAG: cytochrome P450 [Nannocystaceae bacterium]
MPLPPGPQGLVASLRAARVFFRAPMQAMSSLHARYGRTASLSLLGDRLVSVIDPEGIGKVLIDREGVYTKDWVTHGLARFLGDGLLTSENPIWRRQRRLIAPSLSRRHIERYAETMAGMARAYADAIADGAVVDIHADMAKLTLGIVVETLFGAAFTGDPASVASHIDAVMHGFEHLVRSWRRLIPERVPLPSRARMNAASASIHRMVEDIIRERRSSGELGDDLLSRLLAARDESGAAMDDHQLRDEALTLFVAGHETTANALTFTLTLLAEHPELDARLKAEVREVVGDRAPCAADLPALPFTDAVVKEALRLYPPAYLIGREATRETELDGWRVPAKATVLVSSWVLHRQADLYDDPLAFDPQRWLDGRTEGLPRHAYLPFGGGPRICVGNHFAMMEAVLVVATLAQRLRFERTEREPLPLQFAVTLRPARPLPMRARVVA